MPEKSRTSAGRFAKGHSGNPRGRKSGVPNAATLAIRDLAEQLTTGNPRWIAATQRRLIAGKEPAVVVQTLLHYAHGKPVERVAITDPDGAATLFPNLTDDALHRMAATAARVLAAGK
jgi:hypothetical protein